MLLMYETFIFISVKRFLGSLLYKKVGTALKISH